LILILSIKFAEATESSVDPPMSQIERRYKTKDFKFVTLPGNKIYQIIVYFLMA